MPGVDTTVGYLQHLLPEDDGRGGGDGEVSAGGGEACGPFPTLVWPAWLATSPGWTGISGTSC